MFFNLKKIYRFYNFYRGPFKEWSKANKLSHGYDHSKIINRIFVTAKKARDTHKFEKDGFLIDQLENNKVIVEILKKKYNKKINILDFGGGFGTLHNQYKEILDKIDYSWTVVEQSHFVELALKNFKKKNLHFVKNIQEFKENFKQADLAIFSSSLQYVENYEEIIKQILDLSPDYIIFLKTPFNYKLLDQIYIQHIPQNTYEGSYPSWVFSKKTFLENFYENYKILSEEIVEPKLYFVDYHNIYFKMKEK